MRSAILDKKNLIRYLDMWVRYLACVIPRKTGKIVFSDRYFYDLLFYSKCDWISRILVALLPRPTKVFFISNTAEKIHKRKDEKSVEELKKTLKIMRRYCKKFGFSEVIKDNFEKAVAEIKRGILFDKKLHQNFYDKIVL